jgi:DNA modification methylase
LDRGGLSFFHSLVWDKTARGPGLGWRFRRDYEHIMVAHRTGGLLAWRDGAPPLSNIQRDVPPYERLHPNEKPVSLVARMINACTCQGGTVLDPFMGSGTTGVACAQLGRRFIGIEIEERYFQIACRRIEDAQRQGRLFEPQSPRPEQGKLL